MKEILIRGDNLNVGAIQKIEPSKLTAGTMDITWIPAGLMSKEEKIMEIDKDSLIEFDTNVTGNNTKVYLMVAGLNGKSKLLEKINVHDKRSFFHRTIECS